MNYLTLFNLIGLHVPRRWQNGFRWVGNEMPQVPQLLQVFKELVREKTSQATKIKQSFELVIPMNEIY